MHDEVKVMDASVLPVQPVALLDLDYVTHVNQHLEAVVREQLEDRMMVPHLFQVEMLLRRFTCVHYFAIMVHNVSHELLLSLLNFGRLVASRCRD